MYFGRLIINGRIVNHMNHEQEKRMKKIEYETTL